MKGTSCWMWNLKNQRMRVRVEAEVQDIYLTKNPLTAVSVLLCLKLRDFIVISYFRPPARKGISEGAVHHKFWGGV